MKHKILLITALLCMAAQGAWADKWDGRTYKKPEYDLSKEVVYINSAAELAYVCKNWDDEVELFMNDPKYYSARYKLNADLDMTGGKWTPLGSDAFTGLFDGNGHTIRINITEVTDNYQGLFKEIGSGGKVKNLHVAGEIRCKSSRLVGGICGENNGRIQNCWVSANVSSEWTGAGYAKVGGICGQNDGIVEFCCMTGDVTNYDDNVGGIVGDNSGDIIRHCTFYGNLNIDTSKANEDKYAGDKGTVEDCYDTYYDVHYDYASSSGQNMYAYAYKYPYPIDVRTNGYGSVRVSAGGDNDIRGWRSGETVTLTQTLGTVSEVIIRKPDGSIVPLQGQSSDVHSYWFVMPKCDVTATVYFAENIQGSGTEADPYLISSADNWNELAFYVTLGNSYRGKFVKLTADISVSEMLGTSETNSFQGTFLGDGVHTLTFTRGSASAHFGEDCCATFRYVKDATFRDLKVAGDIYTSRKFAGGLIGHCYGTTNIQGCQVSTVIHGSADYPGYEGMLLRSDGGLDGTHGGLVAMPAGALNITGCSYTGRLLTTKSTYNCGGFVGWYNGQTISVTQSLYAPNKDIKAASGENGISEGATFVRGGDPTITNCFYTETMGSAQGKQAFTVVPDGDIYKPFMTIDGKEYYILCTVSNVMDYYEYTGQVITIVPTITAADGTLLKEGTDYTYSISPATVQEKGYYTMTLTGKGSCTGTKTMTFEVEEMPTVSKLTEGEYEIKENVTRTDRIYIKGNVVLHLAKDITCTLKKGIELREGNSLTIDGEGTLTIDGCESGKSGIGARSVGTLTINGGILNVTGGDYAAAIGGDKNNAKGGSITINGGTVNAKGGKLAAGIGGGADDQPGQYGVCGDITINGGQVTAQGGYWVDRSWRYGNQAGIGPGAEIPNPEGDYYDSGTLKLGWTRPTDFIDCSGFANPQGSTLTSIAFADGKVFELEGTDSVATIENCRSRKMVSSVGSKKLPYTISNTDEWNDFVGDVASGNSYKDKFVKLAADISVSTKCGTVEGNARKNAFSGTFDGDGHTITATITDNSNQGTALFSYINGATIKNLKVAGSITGDMHAAAIVGFSTGKNDSITNCAASANVSGGTHIGGILGHGLSSDIAITGCTYSGLMTGGETAKGAIFGWGDDGGVKSVTDCLYIMQDGQDTNGLDLVRKHAGDVKVTNSYKTTKAEQNGGKPQSTRRSVMPDELDKSDKSDESDEDYYDAIWANEYDTMPDYFGEFLFDYGFLKVYEGGLEYDGKYYVANILLADNADNYALVSLTDEYIVDATLTGRTFYKNGTWQTICLPFDVNDFNGTPLEGAKVKELGNTGGCNTGFDAATGTLTLDFVDADKIEAGKPYVVKWESGDDIVEPVFRGVTISDENPIEQRTMSEDERVHFIGIYCPVQLEANNYANLYLGSDGKLHCPEADGFYLNAFNAGFLVDLGDETALSSIVINLGDGTGIRSIDNGQLIIDNSWYSLDGRKLNGKPSRAGVYINDDKKVVIK